VNRYLLLIGTAVAMLFLARLIHVQVERRYAPVLRTALKGLFSQRHDGRESVAP
jgi:hypothetical protein